MSRLRPLFPFEQATSSASPAWQLRALLLVIAEWPAQRVLLAQQRVSQHPPPFATTPADMPQSDSNTIDFVALNKAISRVLEGSNQLPAELAADNTFERSCEWYPAVGQGGVSPPSCAVVGDEPRPPAEACKRELSPTPQTAPKRAASPIGEAPWRRHTRRRRAAQKVTTNGPLLIPLRCVDPSSGALSEVPMEQRTGDADGQTNGASTGALYESAPDDLTSEDLQGALELFAKACDESCEDFQAYPV